MENALIILRQTGVMLIYLLLGFILYRTKLVSREGSQSISGMLIYAILPCMIIHSFCLARTPERTQALLVASAAGVGSLIIAVALGRLLFPKRPLAAFAAMFDNAGFMALPIITAVLGPGSAFYLAPMIALLNCLQFTYGQVLLAGSRRAMRPAAIVKSPLVISFAAGLVLYAVDAGGRIPSLLGETLSTLSGLTGPLAMILLGVYLGQMPLSALVTDALAWRVTGARLLLIPAVTAFAFLLIPAAWRDIALAVMIGSAAPVGVNVAIYAQKLDGDYLFACRTVCQSTLLSVAAMPLMILFAEWIWAAL